MRRVALALVLAAGVAAAEPPRGLAAARRHFADLDFELVIGDSDAVATDPTASPDDRAAALFLRGSALVVLGRDADAAAAFDALLAAAPTYRPARDTSPRILAAFEGARAARLVRIEEELATRDGAKLRAVNVDADAPASGRGGVPLRLHVRVADPDHLVSQLVLGYRRETDRDYSLIYAPAGPTVELAIPGAVLTSDRDYRLGWYVQALHATGARVRQVGDDREPRWIAITAGQVPKPPGVTSHWWFWAGVVTLAASAVTVPILIERGHDVGPQQVVIGR